MEIILTFIAIVGIGIIVFIMLGLLGWGIQFLGIIGSFLGEGITGCIGCFAKFFWVILLALIALALIL